MGCIGTNSRTVCVVIDDCTDATSGIYIMHKNYKNTQKKDNQVNLM